MNCTITQPFGKSFSREKKIEYWWENSKQRKYGRHDLSHFIPYTCLFIYILKENLHEFWFTLKLNSRMFFSVSQ